MRRRAGRGPRLFPRHARRRVRQKTRWLIGIALAGWDRTGWGRRRQLARSLDADARPPRAARDARAGGRLSGAGRWGVLRSCALAGRADAGSAAAISAARVNGVLLLWRLACGRVYRRAPTAREALRSLPRMLVGNIVAMMAARRALFRYVAMLRGGRRLGQDRHHSQTAPAPRSPRDERGRRCASCAVAAAGWVDAHGRCCGRRPGRCRGGRGDRCRRRSPPRRASRGVARRIVQASSTAASGCAVAGRRSLRIAARRRLADARRLSACRRCCALPTPPETRSHRIAAAAAAGPRRSPRRPTASPAAPG